MCVCVCQLKASILLLHHTFIHTHENWFKKYSGFGLRASLSSSTVFFLLHISPLFIFLSTMCVRCYSYSIYEALRKRIHIEQKCHFIWSNENIKPASSQSIHVGNGTNKENPQKPKHSMTTLAFESSIFCSLSLSSHCSSSVRGVKMMACVTVLTVAVWLTTRTSLTKVMWK